MDPSPPEILSLWIVAEDPLVRLGLARALRDFEEIEVSATDERSLGTVLPENEPDLLVVDLGNSDRDGALPLASEFRVLALADDPDRARAALDAGARGVLIRDGDPERIVAAARVICSGALVIDDLFAADWLHQKPAATTNLVEDLTPREREVLCHLAEGLTNPAIAERLGISEHTAKFHVNAILGKLSAQNRTEAVVRAARLGLLHF